MTILNEGEILNFLRLMSPLLRSLKKKKEKGTEGKKKDRHT